MSAPTPLVLGFGCGLAVQSALADALSGLREHFGAWEQPAAAVEVAVHAVCDAAQWQAMGREVAGDAGEPRDVLTLDAGPVRLPTWRRAGRTLAFDDFCGCWYVLQPGRLTVLSHAGSSRPDLALLRVVREAACARTAGPATADLHAAAVEIDGRAVLLCGPKRAGKTSLLCHLLASGAARFVANDRVQLRGDGARTLARGIPTVVRVRAPTLASFSRLARDDAAPGDDALTLSAAEFCARLGARAAPQAPLGALLHVQLDPDGSPWELQHVPASEQHARLAACRYGAARTGPTLIETLLGRAPAPPTPLALAAQPALTAHVPQFVCRLGPAAYAHPAAGLVDALASLWQHAGSADAARA